MQNSYLLDTQVFMWAMEKNKRLSQSVRDVITDPDNTIYISVVTPWEMMIKRGVNKLEVPYDIKTGIKRTGFSLLSVQIDHALAIEKLPLIHKDPFDRMLIAQAKVENLNLITADRNIWKYKVPLLKIQ
jgi:PIN domain nuclease of toxin-antitoxin system